MTDLWTSWLVCHNCEARFWLPRDQRSRMPSGCPNCNPGTHWSGLGWYTLASMLWDDQAVAALYRARWSTQ
jgi:hypothetical protein